MQVKRFTSAATGLATAVTVLLGAAPPAQAAFAWMAVRPTKEQRAAALREHAGAEEGVGDAWAVCEIVEGRLTDCKIVYESPGGAGVSAALLSLAPIYRAPRLTPPVCEEVFNRALIGLDWRRYDAPSAWIQKPVGSQIYDAYPKLAAREHTWGSAAVHCVAPPGGGALDDCRLIYEEPAEWGFGEAALSLSEIYRITGVTSGGTPVENPLTIPVSYSFPHKCEVTRAWRHIRPQE